MASAPSRPEGAILMVANYPPDVGYAWWLMESFWAQIARHFAPLGRRCLLAYPRLGHLSQTIREAPIEVVELDYADRSRAGLAKLEAFVRTHEVRSLYLTDQAPLDLLYGRLRRWGVRRIAVHDHTPGERSAPSRPRRAVKRMLAQSRAFSADRYIGVSRFVHRRFETIGLPPRRCSFVHNGIVPIGRSPACRGYVARHFPVAEDSLVVVSTGRATYYKGVDFLVRCAVRLAAVCERAPVFLHVGDGPDLEAFREAAREARLGDRFLFAGRRSDVREILQSCHIGLHASHGEAFSLSILEYMSAGLASVAPNHCGNPEAIRHGVDGLLYRPGDLAEAVSALERLVADRELRERLGRAAMRRVEDHFTLERAIRAFREEIAQAL